MVKFSEGLCKNTHISTEKKLFLTYGLLPPLFVASENGRNFSQRKQSASLHM